MAHPFLYKLTVLFQIIQFSISTQFNCQKYNNLYFQFSQTVRIKKTQFSISIVLVYKQLKLKTVLFNIIQFSTSTVSMSKQFHFKQFSLA